MKRYTAFFIIAFFAFAAGSLMAQGLTFSGLLDSRVLGNIGAGTGPDFSLGVETWANIRAQAKLREYAAIYSAVNLMAASGSIASAAEAMTALNPGIIPATAFVGGENYIAALELERLYFRVQGEILQLDAGLLRLPFGYSLAWGPSDFLNPRSPLLPDARPRGVLGASFAAYPLGDLKLLTFASAPRDPLSVEGEGFILGLGGENHWDKASVQGFYAFETPGGPYPLGRHRGGLSVKADLELGFVAEALYTWNPEAEESLKGLAAALGFDYSLVDGKLYLLAEYLYSGETSSTAENLRLTNRHYLSASALYSLNEYARLGLSCTAGLEDLSFSPVLSAEYEPFQGMTLNFSVRVPLDRELFSAGDPGELGPERTASSTLLTAKARLRF
ncbi:MAG: hypothetical protein LBD31_00470 [Treponema sp.]|jgi:hypothetical protein|nr:hypothetical protein [Treponema sp.]